MKHTDEDAMCRSGDLVVHALYGVGLVTAADSFSAFVSFDFESGESSDQRNIVLASLRLATPDEIEGWRRSVSTGTLSLSTLAQGRTAAQELSPTSANARRDWSDDELDVLVAAYAANDFSIGDDERDENHVLARAFGRTPAAVDRQWRNVADIDKGGDVLHVGQNVVRAFQRFARDPEQGMERARRLVAEHDWPLRGLLERGS